MLLVSDPDLITHSHLHLVAMFEAGWARARIWTIVLLGEVGPDHKLLGLAFVPGGTSIGFESSLERHCENLVIH